MARGWALLRLALAALASGAVLFNSVPALAGLMASPHWVVNGEQEFALCGIASASAGDVNGDGYDDIIVGAPGHLTNGYDYGKVSVFHGSAVGLKPDVAWEAIGIASQANKLQGIVPQFGRSVASAGDVNGDGYDDVIVGSPQLDGPDSFEGAAFIYYGSKSGIDGSPDILYGHSLHADFGFSVASAGDINSDGYDDVIIGSPFYTIPPEYSEGAFYIYHGSAAGITTVPAFEKSSGSSWAGLGGSVSGGGDINGDGYDDVVIGAYAFSKTLFSEEWGKLFVYHGSPTGLSTLPARQIWGPHVFANLGQAVSIAGDVNNDGYDDVIVGAYRANNPEVQEGIAYLYLGSPSGIPVSPAWTAESDQVAAQMGWTVGAAGDVNNDGYDDAIFSAYFFDAGVADEGRVYIYTGTPTGLSSTPFWVQDGGQQEARFADSANPAGDVNGDGYADIILGTQLWDSAPCDAGFPFCEQGTAWIYMSSCGTTDGDGDGLSPASDPACAAGGIVDCNDGDATLWTPPGEVGTMSISQAAGSLSFSWTDPRAMGSASPALTFDTIRSVAPDDFGAGKAICVESGDGTDRTSSDGGIPDRGEIFYYAVRANNGCASGGTIGAGTDGTIRIARSCP